MALSDLALPDLVMVLSDLALPDLVMALSDLALRWPYQIWPCQTW